MTERRFAGTAVSRRRNGSIVRLFGCLLILCAVSVQADFRSFQKIPVDAALEAKINEIGAQTLQQFAAAKLTAGNLSFTAIDITDPAQPRRASFEGSTPYHPASTVKLFYMVTAYDQIEQQKLKLDEPLIAAMKDMIVDSLNDATSYVVDRISGTTSGPELYGRAYHKWASKRDVTNRLFRPLGYDLNANGKTWCEGVYGREKQLLGKNREGRNRINSDVLAAAMLWIAQRKAISPAASEAMLAILRRDLTANAAGADNMLNGYIGEALPPASLFFDKVGWTSEVRHDVAYMELPDGKKLVLAIAMRGPAENTQILPFVAGKVVAAMTTGGDQ